MRIYENHPLIPEQSEDHAELMSSLANWKGLLPNEPRLQECIRRLESGPDLIKILERIRFGAAGEVTMRSDPDDSDYDVNKPPLFLTDDDLRGLDEWAGTIFEKAELGSGN